MTMGQITNHMSVDAQNLIFAVWALPYQVAVVVILGLFETILVP